MQQRRGAGERGRSPMASLKVTVRSGAPDCFATAVYCAPKRRTTQPYRLYPGHVGHVHVCTHLGPCGCSNAKVSQVDF